MTVLVVGASGATGRLLVAELLRRGVAVRAVVRSASRLSEELRQHTNLTILEADISGAIDADLDPMVAGCGAVASCLGHTMSLRGVFGPPYRLVSRAVARLCGAIERAAPSEPVRFVLMSSSGVQAPGEQLAPKDRAVIAALRLLVPPHADNEQAAAFLRAQVGPAHASIEWAAVRPDSLIDAGSVTAYAVHPAPIRSPIFDAGKTSRINVAHFMASLATEDELWARWKGKMPVLYNASMPGCGRPAPMA